MPVDFFATPCANPLGNCQAATIHCLQNIPNATFSISDVNGSNGLPATVNVANPNPKTDFVMKNDSKTQVRFKAVDWCVEIYRTGTYSLNNGNRNVVQFKSDGAFLPGRDRIKRCEGFLQYNNTIAFIEIKNSRGKGRSWLIDAREKFEETILSFKEHHPALVAQIVKPILSNPSFPGPHPNETIQKKILKDKIGLEFIRQDTITI